MPRHLLPDSAEVAEVAPSGGLSIGGIDVVALAGTVGTPVFLYAHLRSRCQEASRAFDGGAAYASKAFLCRAMAGLVYEEGMKIDVASGGELHVALGAGVPAERIVLHGNNKSSEELALALSAGVSRIVVDSFDEIDRLEKLALDNRASARPRVLVRVNPGVEVHTHAAVATGREDSKFGFPLASGAASDAIGRLDRRDGPLELVGLHAHVGSQLRELSAIGQMVEAVAPLLLEAGLGELCVGGGLGVAYAAGEEPGPTITEWGHAVRTACKRAGIPSSIRLTAEPGRAIAAIAAITCYRIGTVKSVDLPSLGRVRTYVSVDGGMSDNLRPALYGSRYEAFLPRAAASPRPRAVTVSGKHCESGDILVSDAHLPDDVAIGDVLATPVTGAYGYSMASNYNKTPRPPVVFVRDGNYRVVTRRETFEDLVRLDA